MTELDAARQIIRYALETFPCHHALHRIVEEERELVYPGQRSYVMSFDPCSGRRVNETRRT